MEQYLSGFYGYEIGILVPILLEKTLEYASFHRYSEFQVSIVWIEIFMTRHRLFQKPVCGESAVPPVSGCENWKLKIPYIL